MIPQRLDFSIAYDLTVHDSIKLPALVAAAFSVMKRNKAALDNEQKAINKDICEGVAINSIV